MHRIHSHEPARLGYGLLFCLLVGMRFWSIDMDPLCYLWSICCSSNRGL